VKSKILLEAVEEVQGVLGAGEVNITVSPSSLTLSTSGDTGTCTVELPRSREIFASLECFPPTSHSRCYSLKLFMAGMAGLQYAQETCVQMNRVGVCAVQHQVVDLVGRCCFVDFIVGCREDEVEDEDSDVGGYEGREGRDAFEPTQYTEVEGTDGGEVGRGRA